MNRSVRTKIAPQLTGIVVAAAFFVFAMRTDRVPDGAESPLQRAAHKLRIGMTSEEAREAMQIPVELSKPAIASSNSHHDLWYYDPHTSESLWLHFREDGNFMLQQYHDSLTKWAWHR